MRKFKVVDGVLVNVVDVNFCILALDSDENAIFLGDDEQDHLQVCDGTYEDFESEAIEFIENMVGKGATAFELRENENGEQLYYIELAAGCTIIGIIKELWNLILENA